MKLQYVFIAVLEQRRIKESRFTVEYPERTTDHGQATGKLYHLRQRIECTLFVIYKAGHEPTPYW
jgi:hypothetical protein